ncbi:MAG: hypothetical protein NTV86_04970 [Planctomycetota bacterium]|nr:hypothetical protein [Planctomycetota bacterium]
MAKSKITPEDIARLNDIINVLNGIAHVSPGLSTANQASKIYEIFILANIADAASQFAILTAFSTVDNGHGQAVPVAVPPNGTLNFRLSPGDIFDINGAPGFIFMNVNGVKYELQNGISCCGISSEYHELDISIVDEPHASLARFHKQRPLEPWVSFLVECKMRGKKLEFGVGREVVGLIAEFPSTAVWLVSNKQHGAAGNPNRVGPLVHHYKGNTAFNINHANRTQLVMAMQLELSGLL